MKVDVDTGVVSGLKDARASFSFEDWEAWCRECGARGLRGPYRLANDASCYQYLGDSGTAALWNGAMGRGRGTIFTPAGGGKP